MRLFERDDDGYDEARRATVWNARVPDRYPDLVVQATTVEDVVAAVRYAADRGLRVGVRSGGHSWSANHVRDGGLLLDVSRLDSTRLDVAARTAVVGPGCQGSALVAELEAHDLFFPAGHCRGVAVGGYLLQGGYGWNSRALGPACESVLGLDVVLADGTLVHCSADEHPDLYWAARGSGPGFFAVVVAFHLRLHPRPAVCGSSVYVYPATCAAEVYTWAREIAADVDRRVEVQIVCSRGIPALGISEPSLVIASPVFADSEAEAREVLALLETCPVRDESLVAVPFAATTMPEWYDAVMSNYPSEHRYATDNMWTHAPAADLVPRLLDVIADLPPHPAHFLWLTWGPSPARQDMAYSLEDEVYLALYGAWKDESDDAAYADWSRSHMAAMADLATGVQLADENLGARPARFASDEAMARLDQVRAAYDPEGRFHSWMGRAS